MDLYDEQPEDEDEKDIEEEFLLSWNGMERYFKSMSLMSSWKHMEHMVTLIALLRARGYDRQLRAGQSMASFIVSRARKNGLRSLHLSIRFGVGRRGQMVATLSAPDVQVTLEFDCVEITPDLENLLMPLLAHPID